MINYAAEYLLKINEKHRDIIGSEQEIFCRSLVEKFKSGKHSADELYSIVTDEDVLDAYAENASNKYEGFFWQTFISVLMCMVCFEYHREGQKYLPEDIESIQEDKLDEFFTYLKNDAPEPKECFERFCNTVCL
jgi:hypothetical protein